MLSIFPCSLNSTQNTQLLWHIRVRAVSRLMPRYISISSSMSLKIALDGVILAMKGIPHSPCCCSWRRFHQMRNEDRRCCQSGWTFRCRCWFFGFELSCWERGQCGAEPFLPFSCYSAVSFRICAKSEREQTGGLNTVFPVALNPWRTTPFAHRSHRVIKLQRELYAKLFFLFVVASIVFDDESLCTTYHNPLLIQWNFVFS